MRDVVFIINFKAYEKGIGKRAVELAKILERAKDELGCEIWVAVQPTDIYQIAKATKLRVLAQHIDPIEFGAHTGWIHPKAIRDAGAYGTLINHSEHRLELDQIKKTIDAARKWDLITVVCAPDLELISKILEFNPDFIAYEPPELIGGDISVSKAKPEIVKKAVEICKDRVPLLIGAGIKTGEDIKKGIELGAKGFLIASGVVKAKDPYEKMKEFTDALK